MKKLISCILVIAMVAAMAVAFTGCATQVGVDDGKFTVFGYSYESNPDKKEVFEYYQQKW